METCGDSSQWGEAYTYHAEPLNHLAGNGSVPQQAIDYGYMSDNASYYSGYQDCVGQLSPVSTVRRSQSSPVPQAPKPCTGTELSVLNIFSLSVLFSPQSLQSFK